ncbi:related to isotrichodermin C-15 hydroxylase (cytochrome P-450 monooxygenase CYP65A1) [Phialocephala subalpina]|uniref:Related to isotrichodermin C-15 hydroxylase (Cytochrome P-450 monooxygenase CYP65A1) n=1 Tax=Phialocephala subalpina TaxID=576137 RepID=A0A1L7XEL2_9HELO|nr:related to isotrichodermin C-15 hydroxylase (cytochrome P-450 monooxygenase CYP65A1) [Phialocephala subalpina]
MKLSDIFTLLVLSFLAWLLYSLAVAIYNITLHPLAKYPGPKLYAAFTFPHYWQIYNGDQASYVKELHERYGDVVRWAPGLLSFNNPQAFRDIYGTQKGKKMLEKDPEFYKDSFDPEGADSLLEADDATHQRQRRVISHAFSEQALRDQEGIIMGFCNMLISKLHDQIEGPNKGKVDMVRWLNFTTFDIVGDLAFAESFQALEKGEYHFWMATIFHNMKIGVFFRVAKAYPIFNRILMTIVGMIPAAAETIKKLQNDTKDKTMRRINSKTDRKDFISHFLRHNDDEKGGVSTEEIISNAGLFIVAGSETSATLLSGMFFYLLKNPDYMTKLKEEVRSSFTNTEDMTFASQTRLPYLQACIEETLRIYPPVPAELPRVTPPEGVIINGEMIPGNISVGVPHYGMFHSEKNFKNASSYRLERWLGDPAYASDDLTAVQPFSVGTRNCIGKNLAYAEIRSIMCRILWNFELELCPESNNWNQQKVYFLWEKPPLMIKLTARI